MENCLDLIPMLVRVLASLGLILLLGRFCRELLWPMLAGVVALALLSGHGPRAAAAISWARLSSPDNLLLVAAILLVIWLSSQMAACGVLRELVEAARRRLSRRAAIAVLPALIGLLPMPGGALFSAPLVDECDTDRNLCSLLKTRINYWFRHLWEFWWPLYPGVLLAIALTHLEFWRFALILCPLTLIAAAVGWLFLLRRLPAEATPPETTAATPAGVPGLLAPLSPIAITIGVSLIFRFLFPAVANWGGGYLPMIAGLALAMISLQFWRPLASPAWRELLLAKRVWLLVLVVEAVRIYGAFIEAKLPSGTLLVAQMRSELELAHIPTLAMVMFIPFLCGLTTGLAIGFVGASFPIVMNLVPPGLAPGAFAGIVVIAYCCGNAGQMLSPVHVCLIVTNQHFRTDLLQSLRTLVIPCLVVIAGACVYAWLLYALWK